MYQSVSACFDHSYASNVLLKHIYIYVYITYNNYVYLYDTIHWIKSFIL